MKKVVCLAGAVAALASLSGDAQADALNVTFTGHVDMVVDRAGNTLLAPAGIAVGSPFSGVLSYDSAASPAIGPVHNSGPAGGSDQSWFNFSAFNFTVQGNGNPYTFGYGNPVPSGAFYALTRFVTPGQGQDTLQAGASGQQTVQTPFVCSFASPYYGVAFTLIDTTSTVLPNATSLPTSYDLSRFSTHTVDFYCYDNSSGNTDYRVHGNIETISPAPSTTVPAGSWWSGLLLAAFLIVIGSRRGATYPLRA
jgi:hypothetical protein